MPSIAECHFLGSSLRDLRGFPEPVKDRIGHALLEAQRGLEPIKAKALKGFRGRGVLEVVDDHDGDAYRAVYTVRFVEVVYVLHCFQKKSKRGAATPQREIDLVKIRLQAAENDYRQRVAGDSQ